MMYVISNSKGSYFQSIVGTSVVWTKTLAKAKIYNRYFFAVRDKNLLTIWLWQDIQIEQIY